MVKVEDGVPRVPVVEQIKVPQVLGRFGEECHKNSLSTVAPP